MVTPVKNANNWNTIIVKDTLKPTVNLQTKNYTN